MSHAGLNPAQAEAVSTLSGPLLVLAGAGTGKTRVVTFRIANLIRHGTAANRILAVTFTNKAAGEMQERISELIGAPKRGKSDQPRPVIGTFHAQCVQILRRHATRLGYPAKFAIYDRSDQESLARAALREMRVHTDMMRPSDLLFQIGRWKNESIWPPDSAKVARTDKEHLAASAYRRYQQALQNCGAMDFDDLLLQTERLFLEFPDVCEVESGRYDHVLVDEYQDTNGSQYRIIRALALPHRNLCVVGDDDQSIYGWRGADVQHILGFAKDWPDARVVRLEENYRSTGAILEMANRLIEYNAHRHDKTLRPQRPNGQRPRIVQMKDEIEEAKLTVAEIVRLLDRRHYQPSDIAILFRTNEQPRIFETELRAAKVPYALVGSQSFFDRREVRDLLAMFKWIDQSDDEVNLLRVINTPPRGLGTGAVKSIIAEAVKRGQPAWRVMTDLTFYESLTVPARKGVDELKAVREAVLESMEREGLAAGARLLLERVRYAEELQRLYEQAEERDARWASVEELVNAIGEYQDRAKEPTLSGFLAETALAGRELGTDKERKKNANAVGLLTFHAAKGLEFPVVYMIGMEEGLLPHHRSAAGDDAAVDEERRLCYVGVTRAQEQLTLSLALTRRKWGKPRPTTPSRFLYEITGKADNPHKLKRK